MCRHSVKGVTYLFDADDVLTDIRGSTAWAREVSADRRDILARGRALEGGDNFRVFPRGRPSHIDICSIDFSDRSDERAISHNSPMHSQ